MKVSIDFQKSLAPRDLGHLVFFNLLFFLGTVWWQWTWVELVLFMALEGLFGVLEFYVQLFLRMLTAPFYAEGSIVSKLFGVILMTFCGFFVLLFALTGGWFFVMLPFLIPFICFGLHVPEGGGKVQDFLLVHGVEPTVLKQELLYVIVSSLIFIALRSLVLLHKNNKIPTAKFLVTPIIRSWALSLTITPPIILAAFIPSTTLVIVTFLLFKLCSDVLLHYLSQTRVRVSLDSEVCVTTESA